MKKIMRAHARTGGRQVIRIAVVEDDRTDGEYLAQSLKKYSRETDVVQFSSAVDFLTNYEPKYDVVFMDIDMPYLDGMSAARKLRELDEQTCLVFVTSLAQFAVMGYEVAAFDFIVKPFTYSNLCLKLQRLFRHLSTHTEREIIIRTEGNMARVAIEDILYVEITGHRIVYHTKSREIASYGTLKSVEESLDDPLFVRCNKCYLVNLRAVDAIRDSCAVVGGDKLLISYPRKAAFERALTDYLCGGK